MVIIVTGVLFRGKSRGVHPDCCSRSNTGVTLCRGFGIMVSERSVEMLQLGSFMCRKRSKTTSVQFDSTRWFKYDRD